MKKLPAYHRILTSLPIPLLALVAIALGVRENQIHKSTEAKQVLQFMSAGHVLGFEASGMYAGTGSHVLHVEFVSPRSCRPVSDVPDNSRRTFPLSKIDYLNLWDGVTLSYDTPAGAIARSTYRIEPQADVRSISLRYNVPVSVENDGSLRITFATGSMNESAPEAWQERDGKRVPIQIAFAARGDREIGFTAGEYDRSEPLFIDPTLTWNTFLGGAQDDQALALATDTTGNIYVAGLSSATWGSPVRPYTGGYDAFVAKLNPAGALIWNTFLGGTADDGAQGVALDGTGNICAAGFSNGTWGTPVRGYSGNNDAFVAKLDASGNLIWSTFLGSSADDAAQAVAADVAGNIYVGGYSSATWDSPVRAFNGIYDAFAAKLNASGVVTWNTFLGGAGTDMARGIAVDTTGNVLAAGFSTTSWSSPVRAFGGTDDAFAAKMDSNGNLVWNTFLGADSSMASGTTNGTAVAVDLTGNVYVAGFSNVDWGTPVRAFGGVQNAFAAKLSSGGSLTWNTFLGDDTGQDVGSAIRVALSGNIYVVGYSDKTWGSPDLVFSGNIDAFAGRLDSNGNLLSNTFLGSGGSDLGTAVAIDVAENVFVAGYSDNTWGAPVRAYSGGNDGFVAQLVTSLTPTPTPTPTPTSTPTPTATPTSTPTPSPTPTPTPSTGSFVIGDLVAVIGNHVTFWSSQWPDQNPLSGGKAPNTFKGFATAVSPVIVTCGGAWTTQPGSSVSPPPTVPPFITVIVSSSVTKSGSTVSGDITKLVTIQTDPGYSPSPGHAGTGTVVAIICQ